MLVLVVGTGTDVGKTHVTAALVAASGGRAWKPIATGSSDDAERIGAIAPPLYEFVPPISPHLAARRAGVTITAAAIAARARELAFGAAGYFFVESAGGLFSPLSERETNHDLALALGATVLLIAPDRIGVLHDVGATVRASDVVLPVIALSAPAVPDASTGTNAAEILGLRLAHYVIELPRSEPGSDVSARAATALLRALAAAGER